jgi:hypothetical protein
MINHVFEEYVQRKKIDVKNCFLPKNKTCFFVNCNQTLNWHLVEISWKQITGHPSYFVIILKSSRNNSFKETYGNNFNNLYMKNSYWDEIEENLKYFLINDFKLNFNYIISEKYQAKIISWFFFVNSIGSINKLVNKDLANVLSVKNLDNFHKFKEYEFYIDQKLLYLKKNHKVFYNYYEIYFEQEYVDFYWYDSYYFLKEFFIESKLKTQVYTI